jgi:hypothetical protein
LYASGVNPIIASVGLSLPGHFWIKLSDFRGIG